MAENNQTKQIKVLPLVGLKSLRAFNVFHTLLLGLKMTPLNLAKNYEAFFDEFENKTIEEKEKDLRRAILFVPLSMEDLEAVISFATNNDDIPYCDINTGNLNPSQISDIVLAVCLEIAKITVFMGNEDLKKN